MHRSLAVSVPSHILAMSLLGFGLLGLGSLALIQLDAKSAIAAKLDRDVSMDGGRASPQKNAPFSEDRQALSGGVTSTEDLPAGLQVAIEAAFNRDSYYVIPQRDHPDDEALYQAHNRSQGLQVGFGPDGIHIVSRGSEDGLRIELTGVGYGDRRQGVSDASLVVSGNRIDYHRTTSHGIAFTEWYVNEPEGIEQGFTLPTPPVSKTSENDPLVIEFVVSGSLKPRLAQDRSSVSFAHDDVQALRYSELHAFDALGQELPSRMEVRKGHITLVVDDGDALYPLIVDPLITTQQTKLTASDGERHDQFGSSVALSGDTALVGAHRDDDGGSDSGSAYVFVRSGTGWTEQAKLTTSDADAGDLFGLSVALSGDTALIGANRDADAGRHSGSAYVFERSGTVWTEQAKLTASDAGAGDIFGVTVALSGDTALIGAYGDDSASGSAYVFERSGTVWTEQAKLTASDAAGFDFFGFSVALSSDTALVGARLDDDGGSDSGSAYIFERSGNVWTEQAKLTASDAAADDFFGTSVALSGDTAIVSSPHDDDAGGRSGSAYVFVRSGTTWSQQAKLTASDAAADDTFGGRNTTGGHTVALSGDTALVGARGHDDGGFESGSAYVFKRSGTVWTEQLELAASDAATGDAFGFSVALNGDTALVGAIGANTASGSTYVYDLVTETKLTASDAESGDWLGNAVSVSGDTVLVGAYQSRDAGAQSGSAYVFVRTGAVWSQQAKLTASDAALGDLFGVRVALSGDVAVIGAVGNDDAGSFSGSAYVFRRNGTSWNQEAKLTANDAGAGYQFGVAVALSGDIAVIGSVADNHAGPSSGSAYVFVSNGASWSQEAKLTANDAAAGDRFGASVALDVHTAVVGAESETNASGSAYVFCRSGASWSQQAKLRASDAAGGDGFGGTVAVSGDTALVGSSDDDDAGSNSGSAYVFVRSGTTWSEEAKLTASDAAADDRFGWSVALSGNVAFVGSPFAANRGIASGSAYLFERDGTSWVQQAELTASDAAAGDRFGTSVTLTGNQSVVGAPLDDDWGSASGSAYVYEFNIGSTPTGEDIEVQPVDPTTGNAPVSLTFDDVTGAGTTTLTTTSTGAPPPSGFKLGSPPTYFEIDTTATFTGCVEICIDYSDLSFGNESQLKLFHQLPDGTWEDITIPSTAENPNPDTVNKIICGETDSFSAFALFELADPVADIQSLIDTVEALNANNGIINSFDSKLQAAADALVDVNNNNDVAAINALNAFINAVQAQSGKKILVADANQLIADAQAIIGLLNG